MEACYYKKSCFQNNHLVGPILLIWHYVGTSACLENSGDELRENLWIGTEINLGGAVGRAQAHRAGDPS